MLDQTIIVRRQFQPWFFANVNNSIYSWEWGEPLMGNVPNLSLISANRVDVVYNAIGANTQTNPPLLAVFARDPRELTATLDNSNSAVDWTLAMKPCALPKVQYAFPPVGGPYTTNDFFTDPPCGAAADPQPAASIRSVRTYRRGMCRSTIKLQPIIDSVVDGLQSAAVDNTLFYDHPGCTDAHQITVNAYSFLSHNGDISPDPVPTGGFALLFHGYYHHYIPFAVDTSVDFNYRYELTNVDGRLGLRPIRNSYSVTGFRDSDFSGALGPALDNNLPNAVFNGSSEQQVIAPALPAGISPDLPNTLDCVSDSQCGGAHYACMWSETSPGHTACRRLAFGECTPTIDPLTGMPTEKVLEADNVCLSGQQNWDTVIRSGGGVLGVSIADQNALVLTANAKVNGLFPNWRCHTPRPVRAATPVSMGMGCTAGSCPTSTLRGATFQQTCTAIGCLSPCVEDRDCTGGSVCVNTLCVPPAKTRCQYIVKMQRLNVYSDRAELVWFDQPDTSNPAYAAYVGAAASGGQASLCTSDLFDLPQGTYAKNEQQGKLLYKAKRTDNLICLLNNLGWIWDNAGWVYGVAGAVVGAGFLGLLH